MLLSPALEKQKQADLCSTNKVPGQQNYTEKLCLTPTRPPKNQTPHSVYCPVCTHILIGSHEKAQSLVWKVTEHRQSQELLTHVQGSHSSLWSCWVDVWYTRCHEICNLLQCQQACGVLPLLKLLLYHRLQLFTKGLQRILKCHKLSIGSAIILLE